MAGTVPEAGYTWKFILVMQRKVGFEGFNVVLMRGNAYNRAFRCATLTNTPRTPEVKEDKWSGKDASDAAIIRLDARNRLWM